MAQTPAELNVSTGAIKAMAWFFENSLDVLLAVRRNGHTKANPTWKKLTGWDPPEAKGQSFWDFVHPEDRVEARASVEVLHTNERCVFEHRLSIAEGGWLWARTHAVGGEDGWALLILRDIRLEQAALAAAEAKARFLANMSHEIRTPMNGVIGVLHLLAAEPTRQERQRLVAEALASGAGLSDLLNDIIDYSDVEAGRLALFPEPLDPVAELESVLALVRAKAAKKGLDLRASSAEGAGWVLGDPARLRKIFFHLIGNAVKFTEQGSVTVTLSTTGLGEAQRLRLEVVDTGVGIAKDKHADLFERFSQGDGSSTRRFGGPGLGLAVSKRLAEMMGGSIGFASVEGEGSTFWAEVSMPACDRSQETAADAWLSGLRVLVVEDHPTNRLVATKMLGLLGAEVETADDGAQGVAAVERSDFDLVFMDIQMPVMDGVEATRRIRAMSPPKCNVPIVATTANVMPDQLATYRRSGINGVVAKPISPSALLAEVARVAAAPEGPAHVEQGALLA